MIAKWKAKALVQKSISYLPRKEKVNYFFQKYVTKGVYLTDEYFEYKITHARDHIRYFHEYAKQALNQSTILELGTGWYPIIPIALYLNDAKTTISIDIQSWMTKEFILTTIEKFVEWRKAGNLAAYLPYINESKWEKLLDLHTNAASFSENDIKEKIHLQTYLQDARQTDFEEGYFDFICSNNTFEHIPKVVLIPIIKEFQRILKTDGVMSHFIDMSDHFAHFDKSISIYNFLRYSEKTWQRIDNSIQPQNRMRFKDYKAIYNNIGIDIIDESVRKGDIVALQSVPISKELDGYTEEELAISHGYIVSKK